MVTCDEKDREDTRACQQLEKRAFFGLLTSYYVEKSPP